jgi:hypothetical protein
MEVSNPNAATAYEIASLETMTITKLVERSESLGDSKPTPKVNFRGEPRPERPIWRSIPKSACNPQKYQSSRLLNTSEQNLSGCKIFYFLSFSDQRCHTCSQ